MKTSVLALSLLLATGQAQANDYLGTAIGGIAGAVIGNQFGSGTGNVAATALGALVGGQVGNTLSQRYRDPRFYNADPYGVPPNPYVVQRGYSMDPYYAPQRAYQLPADPCAGQTQFNGQYNPGAAQAYCRGQQDYLRQRQQQLEQEAYAAGQAGR